MLPFVPVTLQLTLIAFVVISDAAAPVAPHMAIAVGKNAEVVIPLRGYDIDGNQLTATIDTLPATGQLYQLSSVYSDYGYEPKLGSLLTAGNVLVTGSQNRIIYKPPPNQLPPLGAWAEFKYTVNDGTSSSRPGTVRLVDSTRTLVGSDFSRSSEGWSVLSNGARSPGALHERSTRGPLSYYIHSRDAEINSDATGNDGVRWQFSAPAKFLGAQSLSYGGSLDFLLAAASGDFSSPATRNSNVALVELECSTCNFGRGVRLVRRLGSAGLSFDGKPTPFSLPLTPGAGGGWVVDPKNTLLPWTPPSDCELVAVLGGLSSLRIAGDFTRWYEGVALDSVKLLHGPHRSIPIRCY